MGNGTIITDFQPLEEKRNIITDFQPISMTSSEQGTLETYLTQGEEGQGLSVVDKIMDYLGIRKTQPKTTPLELEGIEKKVMPYQVREEVFGTGRQEEMRKVLQRGLAGASSGMTDLISKALTGEIERPETIIGTVGGALTELAGFILGPYKAATLITGTRLAPTAEGLKRTAQMMTKGAADLGIASGMSSILPSLLESETLTEAVKKVGEHTAVGGLVGAVFPTFAYIENKPLRLAIGLAVMDKIRSGIGEWFTIDDIVMGIVNGTIDRKELALKSYEYLLDMYFISHVPSMKKQVDSFKHNEAIREITKSLNPEEIEKTIIDLEKEGLIPGSKKRETSKVDEQIIDLTEIVAEGKKPKETIMQEIVRKDMEAAEKLPPEEFPILKEELKPETRVEGKPELSPIEKDQFKLPGIKQGLEMKGAKEVTPTLEGTPLMEAAVKVEKERVQPDLFKEKTIEEKPKKKIVYAAGLFGEPGTPDILDWVRDKGGISPETISADIKSITQKEGGFKGKAAIVKKGGMGLDKLRDEAEWEGRVTPATTTDEFFRMIENAVMAGPKRKKLQFKTEKELYDFFDKMAEEGHEEEFRKTGSLASVGKYRSNLPTTMDLPEIVKLAKDLMGGEYPQIREKLRAMKGAALGVFWPKEEGKIALKAEIFKDIDQARWTLSHEIGHLVDYLPEGSMERGNILGRIATLKKYMKEMIEEAPPSLEHWLLKEEGQKEWKKIRAKIRKEARHDAKEEGIDPKEDKDMFNDFVKGRYAELKAEWISEHQFISKQEIMNELKNLTQAIKPFDPIKDDAFTKYRYSSKELYADALSALVNNPFLMKENSPLFYDSFFNYLERKPEVKKLYEEIQDSIKSGANFPERVKDLRESLRKGDEEWFKSVRKQPNIVEDLKAGIIDKDHYLLKKIRPIEKNLSPGENPRYLLEDMRYFVDEPDAYMMDIYHQVKKPIEKAGASWEDFREWAFHQRIINERGEIANPMGWYPERSKQRIAEMQSTMPLQIQSIEKAHEAFWKLRQEFFINRAKGLNVFDKELMDKVSDNEFYATFDLQKYFGDAYGQNTGAKIYKQIGTFQEIGDPIAATIMKDISLMRSMSRIRAVRGVIDVFKKEFPTEIKDADTEWAGKGRRILEPKEPDQYLIVDMVEGKAKGYYVPEYIGNSFERNPLESSIIARVLRKTAQPFRTVFTEVNYGFWLFNIIRDYYRLAKNVPTAKMTTIFPDYLRGIKPAFRSAFKIPDDVIKEMNMNHELVSMQDRQGMKPEDMQIERLLKSYHIVPDDWKNKALKPFGQFFNFFTNVGRAVERIPKVAADQYLQRKFPDMDSEVRAHIVRNAGSPDFLRQGLGYPIYNNFLIFSNAMKEGYRGDYEALSRSPSEYMWKMAKYNFLPKILMKAGAIGLLGTAIKEIYDKATEYDKTNYFIIPLGQTPTGKGVYFRIPQDETGRFMGGIIWKLMEGEFEPMKGGLIDYMAGQAPTVHPMFDVMVDVASYYSGQNPYDHFRGQKAIPELTWKAQDFRTTEAFAKYIANKSGVGLIHRFKSDNDVEIRGELERLINYPILSNVLGRFIKVTDYGEKEHIKQDILEPIQKERAREILDVHEAIQKLVVGEPLTAKDQAAILREEFAGNMVVNKNIIANLGRRHGSAYSEALITAATKEERMAILKELMNKEANP